MSGPAPDGRRVLLVVPYPLADGRGNSVSSARLAEALRALGHAVEVVVALFDTARRDVLS